MSWFLDHWQLVLPLILGAVAIWWLMPTGSSRPRIVAAFLGIAALAVLAGTFSPANDAMVHRGLTGLFGVGAVFAAALMITNSNPVYAALWFAVVTLSVCGLFLLQSAPFLAAATIIVYAGAIIVTFLFVIMLAQQGGTTIYDHRARHPFLATVTACVLLGGMLFALSRNGEKRAEAGPPAVAAEATDPGSELGSMRSLGRTLFTPYLYSVELAGTLLLIATIGAIAIAPRRSQGTL